MTKLADSEIASSLLKRADISIPMPRLVMCLSRYPLFDRRAVTLRSVQERGHDWVVESVVPFQSPVTLYVHPEFVTIVDGDLAGQRAGASRGRDAGWMSDQVGVVARVPASRCSGVMNAVEVVPSSAGMLPVRGRWGTDGATSWRRRRVCKF